jgi:hypothetical protein
MAQPFRSVNQMTEYGIVPLEFFNLLKEDWRPGQPVRYCAHAITPDDHREKELQAPLCPADRPINVQFLQTEE